jgi:hypothetical protein
VQHESITSELIWPENKTPCAKKNRSILGIVLHYQNFIEGYSAKANSCLNSQLNHSKHGKGVHQKRKWDM